MRTLRLATLAAATALALSGCGGSSSSSSSSATPSWSPTTTKSYPAVATKTYTNAQLAEVLGHVKLNGESLTVSNPDTMADRRAGTKSSAAQLAQAQVDPAQCGTLLAGYLAAQTSDSARAHALNATNTLVVDLRASADAKAATTAAGALRALVEGCPTMKLSVASGSGTTTYAPVNLQADGVSDVFAASITSTQDGSSAAPQGTVVAIGTVGNVVVQTGVQSADQLPLLKAGIEAAGAAVRAAAAAK